jgi:putative N6-adenine-specific DNA methylase
VSQHPSDDPERPFFATAAKGTEGALRDELKELGLPRVKASRGGVYFGGDFGSAIRACLHSRIAIRVLERQASFVAREPDALYEGVGSVAWERVLDTRRTLCVDAQIRNTPVTSSVFAAQRVKDAIVDRLRGKHAARPSVDKRDPDVRVALHWVGEQATVLLDVSGASLHARGYRNEGGEAPLKETLAAAIVRLSGWDRQTPFVDPMCGAGTLAIEAALWARAIAPGLARSRFGFERWACHGEAERKRVAELREQAVGDALPVGEHSIFARDADEHTLAIARNNATRAGVRIDFARADVRALRSEHARAWLVTNPPYGERLPRSAAPPSDVADVFRDLRGYRVCALVHDKGLSRGMRQKPVLEHALWNGPLECRLFGWEIE